MDRDPEALSQATGNQPKESLLSEVPVREETEEQ